MTSVMFYLLLLLAAAGHVVFWAAVVNRVHGIGINRRVIDLITALCAMMMAGIPLAIALVFWLRYSGEQLQNFPPGWYVALTYLAAAAMFCVFSAVQRVWHAFHPERCGSMLANHTTRVEIPLAEARTLAAPGIPAFLARLPLNEVLNLQVHEKRIVLPRMPAGTPELRIAHVSDTHMSGRIGRGYFERAMDAVNRAEPDLILITGDIVDRESCVDWLPDTFGRLHSPAGVFFVRGNHDRRIRQKPLVTMLERLGIIHLGGTWQQIMVRDTPVILAGNELPWFGPAPDCSEIPSHDAGGLPLRILLAHGPDQFTWAQQNEFDLMLAGHNHGGQVRIPLLGAILAPSLSGTRYAGGAFRRGNTVLHVSRGTGCLTPIRWNCPPEIAILTLCAPGH